MINIKQIKKKMGGHMKMLAQYFKQNKTTSFKYGDALLIEMHYRQRFNCGVVCNDWTRVFRKFKEIEDGSTDELVAQGKKNPYQRCQRYGIKINEALINDDGSKEWRINYGIQGT